MSNLNKRQRELEIALRTLSMPEGIQFRVWQEPDFPAVQRLAALEGWPTFTNRPEESLTAWRHSWPALVVIEEERMIGFVRGMTDGEITTYVAELLIDARYREKGLGRLLLQACHALNPHTRLDLISTEMAIPFYRREGFHDVGPGMRRSSW